MAFSGATKRSLGTLLYQKLLNSSYTYAHSRCGGGGGLAIVSRRFSSEGSSSSNQTNLIKQLRERTCAPMKDVKAALIESNWDIGPNQNPHLISFVIFIFMSFS
jgi:hypothetical protein